MVSEDLNFYKEVFCKKICRGQLNLCQCLHFCLFRSSIFLKENILMDRKFFIAAYFRETQEMVLDAHARAFRYFNGTCKRGIYDNMSKAVTNVLRGKEREYSQRFAQMCSHYLVRPVACTPGAGWEKGQVESMEVQNWPAGIYYLKATSSHGQVSQNRFVKQ